MSVEPRSLETTEHVADCTCANCDPGRLGFKLPGSQSTLKPYHPRDWGVANERVEAAAVAMMAANETAARYSRNFWRYLAAVALDAVEPADEKRTDGK